MHSKTEKLKSEAGVTLLLSVLLLAAITTIAFSLAAVGFAELETSNDLVETEPVFYASLGVAEEEIFNIKRKVPGTKPVVNSGQSCTSWITLDPSSLALNSSSGRKQHCEFSKDSTAVYEIPLAKSSQDKSVKFYLIDPATAGVGGAGYDSLILENISAQQKIDYILCDYDTETCTPATPVTLDPGQNSGTIALETTKSYELSIWVNNVFLSSSSGAYVSITTGVPSGVRGLPYLNKRAVEIETTFGRLTRRIEALIPLQ